jgi:hypothetical protein
MPKSKRAKASNIRRKKKDMLSKTVKMPKAIRDELRMTCVLRGFSLMRQGFEQTGAVQADTMNDFFHGVNGQRPSQIKMLAEGTSVYKDLYDVTTHTIVSRNKKKGSKSVSATRYRLKSELSRREEGYYTEREITYGDLRKKNRLRGNELSNGRSLVELARKGARSFRKAMAYASEKWDMKTNQPKESGMTIDDVMEYVRRRMYLKDKLKLDSDDEEDKKTVIDLMDDDNKKVSKIGNKKVAKGTKEKSVVDSTDDEMSDDSTNADEDESDDENDKIVNNSNDDNNSKRRRSSSRTRTKAVDITKDVARGNSTTASTNTEETDTEDDEENDNDEDYDAKIDYDESDSDDDGEDDSDRIIVIDDNNDNEDEFVPEEYIFPSYFCFVLWGPFAPKEKQLSLFLLGKFVVTYF